MKIDEEVKSKFASPQIKAVVNLRFTSNYIEAIQNTFMAKFGLTMPQFNILRILRGSGKSIPVNTVKERMVEKSPNTTRLMDKLIDKGLISRERCVKDRRVVFVEITEEGLRVLSELDVEMKKEENILSPKLTDKEANDLSDLLDKLRENVG
jgi:DNA-binding MarR family transcriptional regulator